MPNKSIPIYHITHSIKMNNLATSDIINQACEASTKFAQIFYHKLDKESRDALGELYMDSATLLWNGECIKGKKGIIEHYKNLPPTSITLQSLDTQTMPMMGDLGDLLTIVVGGKITYTSTGDTNKETTFGQTFIVVAHGGLFKIVSDNLRLQIYL